MPKFFLFEEDDVSLLTGNNARWLDFAGRLSEANNGIGMAQTIKVRMLLSPQGIWTVHRQGWSLLRLLRRCGHVRHVQHMSSTRAPAVATQRLLDSMCMSCGRYRVLGGMLLACLKHSPVLIGPLKGGPCCRAMSSQDIAKCGESCAG